MMSKPRKKLSTLLVCLTLVVTCFFSFSGIASAVGFVPKATVKRITNDDAIEASIQISGDGSTIAFINDEDSDDQYQVYVMNSDGTGRQKVFSNSFLAHNIGAQGPRYTEDTTNYSLTFSNRIRLNEDGSKIAIGVREDNGYGVVLFYVMILDTESLEAQFVEADASENLKYYEDGTEVMLSMPTFWDIDDNFKRITYEKHDQHYYGGLFVKDVVGGEAKLLYGINNWTPNENGNYLWMGSMGLPMYFDMSNRDNVAFTAKNLYTGGYGLYIVNCTTGEYSLLESLQTAEIPQISDDGRVVAVWNNSQITVQSTEGLSIMKKDYFFKESSSFYMNGDATMIYYYASADKTEIYDLRNIRNETGYTLTETSEVVYPQDGGIGVYAYSSDFDCNLVSDDGKKAIQPWIDYNTSLTDLFIADVSVMIISDINAHWAEKDIRQMLDKRFLAEREPYVFEPDGLVNRQDFCLSVSKVLDLPLVEEEGLFTDTYYNSIYTLFIEAANRAGIVNGKGGGKFIPKGQITREEMAVMMLRAIKYMTGKTPEDILEGTGATFADNSKISNWAVSSVAAAYKIGLIKGKPNNLFAPKDFATRAEAAVLIKRLATYLEIL